MAPGSYVTRALALALLTCGANAQFIDDGSVLRFSARNGLPQDCVTSLHQTDDGFLWIGTQAGLVRFDGVRFDVFSVADSQGLPSNRIWSVGEGEGAQVWVATEFGVTRVTEERQLAPLAGYAEDTRTLLSDREGILWIAGNRLRGFQEGRFLEGEDLDERIHSLYLDEAGSLWAAGPGGLWYREDAWIQVSDTGTPYIGPGPEGSLFVSDDLGIAQVRKGARELERVSAQNRRGFEKGPGSIVASLVDRSGVFWFGGRNGLFHGRFESETVFRFERTNSPVFRNGEVRTLFEDASGCIWVGTHSLGLVRLGANYLDRIRFPERGRTRFPRHFVDAEGEDAWATITLHGFRCWKGEGWEIPDPPVVEPDAIATAREGGLWVVSGGRYLDRLEGAPFERREAEFANVHGLVEDELGDLWWANLEAVWVMDVDSGKTRRVHELEDAPRTMFAVPGGGAWLCAHGRVTRYTRDGMETIVLPSVYDKAEVRSVAEGDHGELWVATYGHGLLRYWRGEWSRFGLEEGLPDLGLGRILVLDVGVLWINSNRGVLRLECEELRAVARGEREKLRPRMSPTGEGNGAGGGALRDGRLWFPTIRELVLVDPEASLADDRLPPVSIVALSSLGESLPLTGRIELEPLQDELDIVFTVPRFERPLDIEFRYRLEGFDDDWLHAGTQRTVRYTNLPPGDFRFHVEAALPGGPWNRSTAPLEIHLAPSFYQTGWFTALSLAIAGIGLWLLVSFVTLRTRRRNYALQLENRERREVARALQDSQERLRMALLSAEMGTWRWDARGRPLSAFYEERVVDLPGEIHPEDRDRMHGEFEQAVEEDHTLQREFRVVCEDGTQRWIREQGRPHYEKGELDYVTGAWIDITQQKGLEDERVRLEQVLRHKHKMEAVGQLAAGVAHEFNNLLVGILGNAELLLEQMPGKSAFRGALEDISRCGERAAALTHQLLSFSRRDTTATTLFDLNKVLREASKMLRRLLGEKVELEIELATDELWIEADRGAVEQAVINLALNGRDAMPEGGRLRIRTRPEGARIVLEIEDTGCGIDPELQARIFEPFYTTKPPGEGTGLGLATVFSDLEKVGGGIEVESQPGRGSLFRAYWPRGERAIEPAPTSARGVGVELAGVGYTVMVVDDDPSVLKVISTLLRSVGYKVLEAGGPRAALERARDYGGKLDLLLSDVVMPDMDGPELARELRRARPAMRVLFMSGYAADVTRAGELEHPLIMKPPARATLLERIREELTPRRKGSVVVS